MKRYILRTEEGSYFLEESQIFFASELATTKKPPQGPGIALPSVRSCRLIACNSVDWMQQYNATTTAEKPNAWVFVLDGEYSNGTFEGRLVSPHGRYALGLRGDGSVASPIGTVRSRTRPKRRESSQATSMFQAYMSPTIEVNCGTWKLQLSLLGEDCEDKQE